MTVAIHSEDICCCSSLETKTCNVRACRGSYYRFDNNFYSCRTRSFSVRIVLRADGGNGKTTIVFKIWDKKKGLRVCKKPNLTNYFRQTRFRHHCVLCLSVSEQKAAARTEYAVLPFFQIL